MKSEKMSPNVTHDFEFSGGAVYSTTIVDIGAHLSLNTL
jgi:hypothetical protein